ncbi:PLP-dependent aminotransferase family protein [Aestuariicella hydrocarbonica]|uniref:PLP-dependent aminotransferase family protein n=1 Tax=Pseudomaricurvus hydrocarbonicus TaxID=1470433 RepID=A0A9E5MQ86_9GAMM|nr:PLP-dependent aminotransferase family protein [Aestuariicella hydrocarbonica]NHO68426.1 PLP-dependent aminotransferase family protein [Aestuariicella hydrocarbonica]
MLYQTLANDLATQIQQGLYRPGDRLPSVRQLARQRAISVSTAVSAYQQLEMTGLVVAREKSGIFVAVPSARQLGAPVASGSSQPTELQMSDTIARIFAQNRQKGRVHFDLAVPDPALQPATQLKAAVNRVLRHHFNDSLTLFPSPGDLELRRLIAQRMADSGCQVQPQEIVITNGCQEALLISLQALTSPGDVVAVETPCYYGFLQALESLGLTVISIATDAVTGMDMASLEQALQDWPIRVCLCSPRFSNPSGACMPETAKKALVSLAQRHDFYVIEDDIFGELCHSGPTHPFSPKSLRAYDRSGRVIYCSAFSKNLSPGLRLGWVAAGEHRLRAMERQRASTTGTASLPQLQLLDYLKTGHFDKHLAKVRRQYAANLQRALAVIARAFPLGTQATRPQGGFVLWISLPSSGPDAMALLEMAQAHNICFVPGQVFGFQGLDHCLRLSVAQPWTDTLETALETLGRLAQV